MSLGTIGKYEKLDVLGHGASGIVYLAWDKLLGKHVALKEISLQSEDEARFLEEARVLDRLRHPNIVQVNSVDRIDGHLIIDMELVKGTNLHEYMRKNGKLSIREALSVAIQICDALNFAHENHTVHRDVKPANVLINSDGVAKIVDFGLAEILGSGSYAGGAGTYAYMAPEDFEEVERSDYKSDIWSVGVTIYEMLTGRRPFQAIKPKDPFSWKRTVEEDVPTPLKEIDPSFPPRLQAVIDMALAKDKSDRYVSAGKLRDDLSDILAGLGGPIHLRDLSEVDVAQPPQQVELPIESAIPGEIGVEVRLNPTEIDFGKVRKGDNCTEALHVRVPGWGKTQGRVVSQPGWITITPKAFGHRKQKLLLTADSENAGYCGAYEDKLVLEVEDRTVSIPLFMDVISRRRSFAEVWWWYVPLMLLSILPIFSQRAGHGGDVASLIAMGFLSVMLLIITIVADLGVVMRVLPAVTAAIGLGATSSIIWGVLSGADKGGLKGDGHIIIGSLFSFCVALQLLTASKWRAWAFCHAICAICVSYMLIR